MHRGFRIAVRMTELGSLDLRDRSSLLLSGSREADLGTDGSPDSPLEGSGFEPSVPLWKERSFADASHTDSRSFGRCERNQSGADQKFESVFLQRWVMCELAERSPSSPPPDHTKIRQTVRR